NRATTTRRSIPQAAIVSAQASTPSATRPHACSEWCISSRTEAASSPLGGMNSSYSAASARYRRPSVERLSIAVPFRMASPVWIGSGMTCAFVVLVPAARAANGLAAGLAETGDGGAGVAVDTVEAPVTPPGATVAAARLGLVRHRLAYGASSPRRTA